MSSASYPQRRRIQIDYLTESREQAEVFEDALIDLARSATVVNVKRIRVVQHDHIRGFKPRVEAIP